MCVCVSSYPLCVTRHWRSPSFLKISTVMSIGVWSVTVKGLRSMMHLSRRGGGASGGSNGVCSVKTTWEALTMPSWRLRALSERSKVGFVETKLLCIQKQKTKKNNPVTRSLFTHEHNSYLLIWADLSWVQIPQAFGTPKRQPQGSH